MVRDLSCLRQLHFTPKLNGDRHSICGITLATKARVVRSQQTLIIRIWFDLLSDSWTALANLSISFETRRVSEHVHRSYQCLLGFRQMPLQSRAERASQPDSTADLTAGPSASAVPQPGAPACPRANCLRESRDCFPRTRAYEDRHERKIPLGSCPTSRFIFSDPPIRPPGMRASAVSACDQSRMLPRMGPGGLAIVPICPSIGCRAGPSAGLVEPQTQNGCVQSADAAKYGSEARS